MMQYTKRSTDHYMVVNEKDWENMSDDQKTWLLFNSMQWLCERVKILERQSMYHKIYAGLGGIAGGFLAVYCGKFIGS